MTSSNGQRLWMRSHDGRWIPVPTGAGQDSNIRSLNIRNTTGWVTPSWGWHLWNRKGMVSPLDALDVYLPGVSWKGAQSQFGVLPFYNPNYISRSTTNLFSPQQPNWIRLFHTQPRTDPNWRIVTLGNQKMPTHVPNTTVNYQISDSPTEYLYFWPSLGGYSHGFNQVSDFGYTWVDAGNSQAGFPVLSTFAYGSSRDLPNNTPGAEYVTALDLAAIRKRLTDDYPQQGQDFVGQYAPISDMQLRRIYIHGTYGGSISFLGEDPASVNLNSIAFSCYYALNDGFVFPVAYDDSPYGWKKTYNVASPTTVSLTPTCVPFAQFYGSDLSLVDSPRGSRHAISGANNVQFDLEFEAPPETNITFRSQIENRPQMLQPGNVNESWQTVLSFSVISISLHYATAGHDTPAETHNWQSIGQ